MVSRTKLKDSTQKIKNQVKMVLFNLIFKYLTVFLKEKKVIRERTVLV